MTVTFKDYSKSGVVYVFPRFCFLIRSVRYQNVHNDVYVLQMVVGIIRSSLAGQDQRSRTRNYIILRLLCLEIHINKMKKITLILVQR